MSFLDLAKKRCSTRAYQPVPVSQEHIDAIVEAARVAPTAANRQPVRILQVTSEEGLASLAKAANVFDAPLAFVVCADGEKEFGLPETLVPVNILAVGHPAGELKSPDRHATERIPTSELVIHA